MRARLRSWWQKIKQRRVTILIVVIILVVAITLIIIEVKSYGTGFAGKTLWEWLNLLGVLAIPAAVGLGTIWFTRQQAKVSDAENKDNQHETALQTYIDKMSELLLEKKLRESAKDDEVRTIARVRTLTVLNGLDVTRKGSVLQFLYESGLIDKNKPIIDLSGADLSEANLSGANLSGANLVEAILLGAILAAANLREADLSGAALFWADLRVADLSGAIFFGAHLNGVCLSGAHLSDADFSVASLEDATGITTEELEKTAKSLKGAIMPDGSKHP